MSYTKREFIQGAYAEIGLASYVFDLSAEDLALALRRLDSMMAEWAAKGIVIGYPLTAPSALEDPTTVPDAANEAVIANLGIRLAPGVGKAVSNDTRVVAKNGLNQLLIVASAPTEMTIAGLPAGAGYKLTNSEFL